MKKAAAIEEVRDTAGIRAALLAWYDRNKRALPWRDVCDPYAIWLSEVMLQQTQVVTVIPYWRRFLERFPTVTSLAAAPLTDVLALWKGLGYYSRARNLHRAAQAVVEHHGSRLPTTAEALLTLPGFGRYTAGAVASIAHGEVVPLVDGNVARVFARLFEVEGAPGEKEREAKMWSLAAGLVSPSRPGDFNQALMELGATVCRPEQPTCPLCPLQQQCGALAAGRVAELPPPRVRAAPKKLHLALGVWRRGKTLLLGRRAEKGLFGGLWELPAVPEGSAREQAFSVALGVPVEVGEALGQVSRTLTHRKLELSLFALSGARRPTCAPGYLELTWATKTQLETLGVSTAMRKAIELVAP